MKHKDRYEHAEITLITFGFTDIITSSDGESMSTGSGNKTDDGWTPVEW